MYDRGAGAHYYTPHNYSIDDRRWQHINALVAHSVWYCAREHARAHRNWFAVYCADRVCGVRQAQAAHITPEIMRWISCAHESVTN